MEFTTFSDISATVDFPSPERGIDPDRRPDIPSQRFFSRRLDSHEIDPDIRPVVHQVSFRGFRDVGGIADIQYGGTCWAEAIQKAIQLTLGDKTGRWNNLSAEIIARVFLEPQKWDAFENKYSPLAIERYNIPSSRYPDMFRVFGIEAENCSFSHKVLQEALGDNRPVLVAGNARFLDGLYAPKDENHVLVAVDWNKTTKRYTLLDSNFGHVYEVSPQTLEKFARGDVPHQMADAMVGQMTVVKTPSAWTDLSAALDENNTGWERRLRFVDGRLAVSLDDFPRFAKGGETGGRTTLKSNGESKAGNISFGKSGDEELDRLLDEAGKLRQGIQADFEASGGIRACIERGLQKWKSERVALENHIRRTLAWLDKASPEDVRRYAGNIEIEKMKTADEAKRRAFLQEMTEWKERQIKGQNQEQFDAEKKGYRQVFPSHLPSNWGKDHNIFEKDGTYYRLIPGTGGKMEQLFRS